MNIYLAAPLFTENERKNCADYASALRKAGHSVYVPMEHQIEGGWEISNAEWGKLVFLEDVRAIKACDKVVCLYYGLYSDSGTAWECGYAYGQGIPVELVNLVEAEDDNRISLMVINASENPSDFEGFEQT